MTLKENQIQADSHTLEARYGQRNPRAFGETDEEYHNRLNTGRATANVGVDGRTRLPQESEADFTNRVGKPGVRVKGETEAQFQARTGRVNEAVRADGETEAQFQARNKTDGPAKDHPSGRNETEAERVARVNAENRV